jgi:hypothetical protein
MIERTYYRAPLEAAYKIMTEESILLPAKKGRVFSVEPLNREGFPDCDRVKGQKAYFKDEVEVLGTATGDLGPVQLSGYLSEGTVHISQLKFPLPLPRGNYGDFLTATENKFGSRISCGLIGLEKFSVGIVDFRFMSPTLGQCVDAAEETYGKLTAD